MEPYFISPHYTSASFPAPLNLQNAITVFEDRIEVWQAGAAIDMQNRKIPDRGIAQLHVLTSYFEMIAQYVQGCTSKGHEEDFFKFGFLEVFPELKQWPWEYTDRILKLMFDDVRCGLYHTGLTRSGIMLEADADSAFRYDPKTKEVSLDPDKLAAKIMCHMKEYVARLRNPANEELQDNFYKCFNRITKA